MFIVVQVYTKGSDIATRSTYSTSGGAKTISHIKSKHTANKPPTFPTCQSLRDFLCRLRYSRSPITQALWEIRRAEMEFQVNVNAANSIALMWSTPCSCCWHFAAHTSFAQRVTSTNCFALLFTNEHTAPNRNRPPSTAMCNFVLQTDIYPRFSEVAAAAAEAATSNCCTRVAGSPSS